MTFPNGGKRDEHHPNRSGTWSRFSGTSWGAPQGGIEHSMYRNATDLGDWGGTSIDAFVTQRPGGMYGTRVETSDPVNGITRSDVTRNWRTPRRAQIAGEVLTKRHLKGD